MKDLGDRVGDEPFIFNDKFCTGCLDKLIKFTLFFFGFFSVPELKNISSEEVPCAEGQFRCKNGLCIANTLVCNYQKDCPDGEDERQSCGKYTQKKKKSNCESVSSRSQ